MHGRYYNNTRYSGLTNYIMNSYLNPLLQLLRFTPIVRNIALHHAAGSCNHDRCLLCEIGFLCDMLERSRGKWCQATNFLLAYRNIPEGTRSVTKRTLQQADISSLFSRPASYCRGSLSAEHARRENYSCHPIPPAANVSRLSQSEPF